MNTQEELVQYYRWLRLYGLNDSHSGNASIRQNNIVWITPTGACADTLQVTDLIRCELGQPIPSQASSDAPLHLAVYEKNPNANVVLHSHGAYSVAITFNGVDYVPEDYEGQFYFEKIPVVTVDYKHFNRDSPVLVAEQLAHYPVAVVKGHGVYVQANTLNLAYKWTCSFELSAKTVYLARQLLR
jgi:L-fuculose-phosphate aldolase